jgi:hypothetical protein
MDLEDADCQGSDCSAWRPQVREDTDGVVGLWLYGDEKGSSRPVPTGLGVCAENMNAPPWRDPVAPKESSDG